ncbi:hypothetical protein Pan54_31830 [Rubinisphaera italica]|uniref:Uncharacterized protein n=1 Tax=Rubinisphaera italica TaxID=2527969 RepID=A0A5C5XJA2_9PLAN|nr:hypothetical protein Pan54_31830 [Rubinisphaera italica]
MSKWLSVKPLRIFKLSFKDEGIRSCLRLLHRKPVHCLWLKKSANCDPASRLLRDAAAALVEAVATAELAALADLAVAAAVADVTDLQYVRGNLTDRKRMSFRSVFHIIKAGNTSTKRKRVSQVNYGLTRLRFVLVTT